MTYWKHLISSLSLAAAAAAAKRGNQKKGREQEGFGILCEWEGRKGYGDRNSITYTYLPIYLPIYPSSHPPDYL